MIAIKRLASGGPWPDFSSLAAPTHRVTKKREFLAVGLALKVESIGWKINWLSACLTQSFRNFPNLLVVVITFTMGFPEKPIAQVPEPSELSFENALRLAEKRSYSLKAQDAKGRASREKAVSAGSLPDPVLQLSIDSLPVTGSMRYSLTDDFMTMRSFGVAQTFTGSGKRDARRSKFEREADLASAMRLIELARLRTETARAWFGRFYQQRILHLLERQREEAVLTAEAVEIAYRSGRGAQNDVFSAREEISRIENRIHETRAEVKNSITFLARWIGDEAILPLGALPAMSNARWEAHGVANQVDMHPEIQVMNKKEQVVLAEVNVAREDKNADWSLSLMFSKRGDNFSDMISVGASIPLQWNQKNLQDRELAARLEEVAEIRAEREEMRRQHHSEAERMLEIWRAHLAQLKEYDQSLIRLAAERTNATLAAYRGGKGPLSSVLEARRMEINSRSERLLVEKQAAIIWAWLEFLIPEPDVPADATISKSDKESER